MVPEHLRLLASAEGEERGLEPIAPRYWGLLYKLISFRVLESD